MNDPHDTGGKSVDGCWSALVCTATAGILLLSALSCSAAPPNEPVEAASGQITLDQVSKALSEAKTVHTRFFQERHLSLFSEPLRSEGTLCFEQPDRVRWQVTSPYESILISDGSGVAQFEWVDGKWKRLDMGLQAAMQNIVSQIAGIMRGEYAKGQHEAALTRTSDGFMVTLTPRNDKMRKMIAAIEVHLAPDLKATRKVVLREKQGDWTGIRFEEQVINVKFNPRTFDRSAPLDLRHVREEGMAAAK